MRDATRLIEDGVGRTKLKVTLPGGRYQLSLNDGAVNLYMDSLGLEHGDRVPEPTVPVVVATGDAWFPHATDVDGIIEDLPADGSVGPDEEAALEAYLTTTWMSPQEKERVLDVLESVSLSTEIDPSAFQVKELPSLPDGVFDADDDAGDTMAGDVSTDETPSPASDLSDVRDTPAPDASTNQESRESSETTETTDADRLQEVPGIGETRAAAIRDAGIGSIDDLASTRPGDLAAGSTLPYELAMVAVEGASEIVGGKRPTAARLAEETGTSHGEFDAALSSLAASGVPPSEASPALRVLFGPTVADIDGVTGQQAYFLWQAGFQTPADVVQASVDDLTAVRSLGAKTAPTIQDAARAMLDGATVAQ